MNLSLRLKDVQTDTIDQAFPFFTQLNPCALFKIPMLPTFERTPHWKQDAFHRGYVTFSVPRACIEKV